MPTTPGPVSAMSRRDARREYNTAMKAKPCRLTQIAAALAANDVTVMDPLGPTVSEAEAVIHWFAEGSEVMTAEYQQCPAEWLSVAYDLNLLLGQAVIRESNGTVHWAFCDRPKSSVSYQRHVLTAMPAVPPHYGVEFERVLVAHVLGGPRLEDPDDYAIFRLFRSVLRKFSR